MILNDIVATLQFLLIKVLTFTVYYVLSNVYDTLYQRVADQLCLFTTCLFLQRPMGKARIIF